MEKKLMALNLMKTRQVRKNNFARKIIILGGVIATGTFLVYKFELFNMI